MSETIIVIVICTAAVLYIIRRVYLLVKGKSPCCSGSGNTSGGCGCCCRHCNCECSKEENSQNS